MAKKLSLGRGLDSLFSDNEIEEQSGVQTLRVSQIEPKSNQPRRIFSDGPLEELAASIKEHGVIQPILVRERANGYYEIIAGERRWRASRALGLNDIPAVVVEADDFRAAQMSLIENLQRENLNPFEEAGAYQALMDEFGLTQEEVSKQVGKSRPAVANALRLMELPERVRDKIVNGKLTAGHGRALLSLPSKEAMEAVADLAVAKEWSVRQTEEQVRKKGSNQSWKQEKMPVPDYATDLERRVTEACGRVVKIQPRKKHLCIEYVDNEDLSALLERICGTKINVDN